MIYLYDSTTKVFTYNGQPMPKAYEVITDRTINDEFFVTGKHPLDESQRYKLIQKDKIIKAHTPDGMQPFRIMDVNKRLGYVEFEAWPLLYADLRKKLIKPFTLRVATGQSVLNTFVGNLLLDTPFTFNSNIIDTHDFKVQDETEAEQDPNQLYDALEILKRIVNRWGGELVIDGYDIRMVDRIGKDTDALLYEKKNITDFVDKESIQEIVTRLHGKAEWTEDNPNGGDQITKRIQTTVNSPLINAYSGIVFEQQFTNNDIHTEQELKDWLNLKFNTENIDKPSRSIELDTNIIDATEIALGDTLNLKYLKHDVDMQIRVMRYQYDGFYNRYIKVYVGDFEEHFTGSVQNSITTVETNVKNSVDKTIAHVIINQLGLKIVYSEYEPEGDYSEGDIWFDNKGGMFFWNEESANWIPHPFNNRVDAIGQEVDNVIKQADADRETANQKIEQAVADATAYTNTKAQEFDTKLLAVNQEIANVTQSANTAVTKADQAVQDVGFMQIDVTTAKTNATSALENANTAKSNANTALTNAETAISTANTAKSNAGTALSNANAALNRVGSVEETTGTLSTSYDNLTKTVALKADQTTVDGIKGTVTTQGIAITANATAIGLKADKSVVDTINGTVANHTTDIKANSDGLKLKADSTTVNSIKGTVDTHTTQIKAASDGLTLKADKSQVDTIKGTVDKHTLDISANATALGLKADKSVVDSIKGTVDKHTLDIKAAADGLTLKADSSLVNTIKGTVDTHTTQISANSTAINARLTSAQVETLLTGKKYVNETTLNATANGLSASITQVSSDLSNLEIGGRNLLVGSNRSFNNEKYALATYYFGGDVPKPGEEVTLVMKYKLGSGRDYLTAFSSGGYMQLASFGQPDESGIVQKTFIMRYSSGRTPDDNDAFKSIIIYQFPNNTALGSSYVEWVKLVRGSKTSNDWTPAPEDMATLEQFTTIDATVKGLQTTVGNKAEQSQVTQLAGQISSKVESATYNSKMTQLDSAINLRVTKGDVTAQINVEAGVTLISNKRLLLDANTYIMGTTFANDVKAKSLEAVYADIATLKTKVLTADVITSTMVKSDAALITKLFATDANVNVLTAKAAFINSVKATTITADKVTGGTANFANFNVINFNAANITSGTVTGANSAWNLNTGLMTFTNPSTNDTLQLTQGQIQFQNGAQTRLLQYNAEGLQLLPGSGNTGTSRNTSLHLIGGAVGSYQYIQFISGDGINQRLETVGNSMTLQHAADGLVLIKAYGADNHSGIIRAARFETSDATGNTLEMDGDQIRTPRDGSRNIFLTPQGTGAVIAGASGGIRYNVNASDFVKQSSRTTKTNIVPLQGGLDVINALTPVSYNKIDKLNQGIYEVEKGFISEDSPMVATPDRMGIYDSHITAHLVKAVQELDVRTTSETEELKAKITELERKIQQLESAA